MIRLLVDDREDKIKNNISFAFELYKRRVVKIRKIHGNEFNIEFLGVDENGCEIYKGDKDSWKNFINYLYELYNKHFNFIMDDTKNKNENERENEGMEKMSNSILAEEYNKTCEEILNQVNKNNESLEEIKSELYKLSNKSAVNAVNNTVDYAKRDIRTITLDAPDYDAMKAKAEAFDKIIEIVCHDGVKFNQSWDKQEIRKNVKGGSVKVGEITGKWHGEIKFTGDEGQKDFGEFVNAMIDGMDEEMRGKILVGE